ncbi:hypothetical protein BG004_001823, partial [Podila humilis]
MSSRTEQIAAGQRSRAYFSDKSNALLESIFKMNQFPPKDLKAELALKIKITEVQVTNWFSRRRKKAADEALAKQNQAAMLEQLNRSKSASPAPHTVFVRVKFVASVGLRVLRLWVMDAIKGPSETPNTDLLFKAILVLKALPLTLTKLVDLRLAKTIKNLAKDAANAASALESQWRQLVNDQSSEPMGADSSLASVNGRKMHRAGQNDRDVDMSLALTPALPKFKKGARVTPLSVDSTTKVDKPLDTPPKASPKITENAGFFKELAPPVRPSPVSSLSLPPIPPPSKRMRPSSPPRSEIKPPLIVQIQQDQVMNTAPPVLGTTPPLLDTTPPVSPKTTAPAVENQKPASPPPSVPILSPTTTVSSPPEPKPDVVLSNIQPPSPPRPHVEESTVLEVQIDTAMEDVQQISSILPLSIETEPTTPTESTTAATTAETTAMTTEIVVAEPRPGSKPSSLRKGIEGAKKKVVRFRAADELLMIRYIEPRDSVDYTNPDDEDDLGRLTGYSNNNNSSNADMSGGSNRSQFLVSQKERDALMDGSMWQAPPPLILDEECQVEWGRESTENQVQELREMGTLSATYLQDAYIPPSPQEPEPEYCDPTVTVRPILLFEPTGDHSDILMNSLALLTQMVSKPGSQTQATAAPMATTPTPRYAGYSTQQLPYGQSPYAQPMYGLEHQLQLQQQPQQQQQQQSVYHTMNSNPLMAFAQQMTSQPATVTQASSAPVIPSAESTRMLLELLQSQNNQVPQQQQQQQQQLQQANPFAQL